MSGTLELTIPSKTTVPKSLANTDGQTVIDGDAKLVKYAEQTGLEKTSTSTLVEAFRPIFSKARQAIAGAAGVAESVKDATCVKEIRKSRACRLAIREVRLESDKVRKKHKEHALLYGRAVDGFHNILLADLSPVETALQEAEDIAERAEAARLAALKAAREADIKPFLDGSDIPLMGDLSALTEKAFGELLANYKLLRQTKLEAFAKAEADRKAKEAADRAERERINTENARLKAEAAETERLAAIERKRVADERAAEKAKADAELARIEAERAVERKKAEDERKAIEAKARSEAEKAEREAAKLKAELEAKAKAEAAEKARVEAERKATEKAAREAAVAPDKSKLKLFADAMRRTVPPSLSNETVLAEVKDQIAAFADVLETLIKTL